MESGNPTARVLQEAGLDALVRGRSAIALERIARGGGATRWYWLRGSADVERLCEQLTPGSVVSLYFDDRIQHRVLDDEAVIEVLALIAESGDAVMGRLAQDELEILVDSVAGPGDLSEFRSTLMPGEPAFFGAFPGRDNDGGAITLTLPDADGVVREHPH